MAERAKRPFNEPMPPTKTIALLLCAALASAAKGCSRRHLDMRPSQGDPIGHDVTTAGDALRSGDRFGDADARGDDASGDGDVGMNGDSGAQGDPSAVGDANATGDANAAGDDNGPGDPGTAGDANSSGDANNPGDAGGGSGTVWIEVDYSGRHPDEYGSTADWSNSETPGWGEAQWAPDGSSWPYIHVPDGSGLTTDPIGGTVLELGCHDRFRLFFGLEELSQVTAAWVTVEGRSRATSSSVDFEVWNPGGGGIVAQGSMSNDWTADVVTVPFDAVPGDGFQAVEIAPIARSCNLAIRRVRLTLEGIQ